MAQSDRWSLSTLRTLCRNELADVGTRTQWSDAELNGYLTDWQDCLQNDFEFCWGQTTATLGTSTTGGAQWNFFQWNGTAFNASGSSTSLSTITLANIASDIMRPADVYFLLTASGIASRLVPRNKVDLDLQQRDWRAAPSANIPVVVYQDDPSSLSFWPNPTGSGTVIIEYPVLTTLVTDTATMQIPAFCRYSARHYVAYRALMRFGAAQNLAKAARYRRLWDRDIQRVSKTWQSFQPDKSEMLRPGGKWTADVLNPRTTRIARV